MAQTLYCSFCAKSEHKVKQLVAGPSVFICNECIDLCSDIVHNEHKILRSMWRGTLPETSEIRKALDKEIDGQDDAKRLLAYFVQDFYRPWDDAGNRVGMASDACTMLFTGSSTACRGIARGIGRCLDAPFTVVDATQLMELRDAQETVDQIVLRLVHDSESHFRNAERGYLFIEHLDQLGHLARGSDDRLSEHGKRAQQAVVKLMAGTVVDISTAPKRPINIDTGSMMVFCAGTFPGLPAPDDEQSRPASQDADTDAGGFAPLPCLSVAQRQALVEFGLLSELVDRLSVHLALDPVDPAEEPRR